jgi:hypothetical protein
MKSTLHQILCLSLFVCVQNVTAQSTTPSTAPTAKVSKDCGGLEPRAKQECLKVARQMEKAAAEPHDPALAAPAPNSSGTERAYHSSPVMRPKQNKKAPRKSGHRPPKTMQSSSDQPPK